MNCNPAKTIFSGNHLYGQVTSNVRSGDNATLAQGASPPDAQFVRPNAYERGRAHVIVYNWSRRPSVAIDLSRSGLKKGERFEIRDVQNLFGPPVASGVYGNAPVTISMNLLTAATALATPPIQMVHTAPVFGVFVVLPH